MMVLITSACGEGSDELACTHDVAKAFASRINKVCKLKKILNNFTFLPNAYINKCSQLI